MNSPRQHVPTFLEPFDLLQFKLHIFSALQSTAQPEIRCTRFVTARPVPLSQKVNGYNVKTWKSVLSDVGVAIIHDPFLMVFRPHVSSHSSTLECQSFTGTAVHYRNNNNNEKTTITTILLLQLQQLQLQLMTTTTTRTTTTTPTRTTTTTPPQSKPRHQITLYIVTLQLPVQLQ